MEWDQSWKTWDQSGSCTSWYSNEYVDTITGLCTRCDDGQYYADIHQQCYDWAGSCYGLCSYQQFWIAWPDDQYLDLDTLQCVSQWDVVNQIAINNQQFGNRSICRSFQYYVNPNSDDVVEFGTFDHPYKSLGYVFVEILNYHSHNDRNITVSVMENTTNYIMAESSYIVNVTKVTIKPYSKDLSIEPNRAIIVAIDNGVLSDTKGTSLNILSNYDLNMDEMITNNPGITSSEKDQITLSRYIFCIIRSEFTFDNIDIYSNHSDYNVNYLFFLFIYIQNRLVTLTNMHSEISGTILLTHDPIVMHIENIDVDFYKSKGGFGIGAEWNYPEAYQQGMINIK